MKFAITALTIGFVFIGCARAPVRSSDQAMRPTPTPQLSDDGQFADLAAAIKRDIEGLKLRLIAGLNTMRFGPRVIDTFSYARALQDLSEELGKTSDPKIISQYLQTHFDFYEVYGGDHWGDVFITGYYEPVIEGRRHKTGKFTEPLRTLPKDMVTVHLAKFDQAVPSLRSNDVLRGRLINGAAGSEVTPFESRANIDMSPLIKGETKIIAWVDPVDAFFLQIQGSGRIDLQSAHGKVDSIYVNYAGQNGYSYIPIGKFVTDKIPKDKMSMIKLEEYLHSLPEEQAQKLMNENPSYVFFEKAKTPAKTELGVTASAGRTIATDSRLFAKGSLAYLEYQTPVFATPQTDDPSNFQLTHRFVFDQDTGGAIRGPGRVDFFVGDGPDAGRISSVMRQHGRLYYLVPKVLAPKPEPKLVPNAK